MDISAQFTGINAVMNYAPTIMGNLGMEPLVGNFVVMAWNFVTTLAAIPLAWYFTMRQMYLGATLVASVACLLLCGIPVYPGVSSTNVKNGVAITGIAIFIAAFELGVGPCLFVLAQQLFPRSFRPKGSSVLMVVLFLTNIIINVCYPIATEGMSGGPSGNQDKGQAIAFIFFGCTGSVCFAVLVFFLFPWEEEAPQSRGDADEEPVPPERQSQTEAAAPGNRQGA
ncbi:hexose transporter [Trypanosoma conorhini]|uniref:Hexose transporter n=1 Tax=Trypanosoma conorhini TaxID=83891 RepID=A0A3R7RSA9_9TRYP|nr:hexose transporter [Trypanosoma conorhini]RNF11894.1 hexose transporter [Trypanosoma conorhini]